MNIFHYPWRFSLAKEDYEDLPLPQDGFASPEIGAFFKRPPSDGRSPLGEIPGPTLEEGAGQVWSEVPGLGRVDYDKDSAHQFKGEKIDSPVQKFHYALTDSMIWLCDALYRFREQQYNVFADRSLSEVCKEFFQYLGSERDFAPESLIVEIARDSLIPIEGIIRQPRMALRRIHENIPLDRLQEMDSHSLLDYARRLGKTAAMKAGPRQRLMAITRVESCDTYENRVVLDFICRAEQLAKQYCSSMCSRCPNRDTYIHDPLSVDCLSDRVRLVAHYQRMCAAWRKSTTMQTVSCLAKPCSRPNYALQQNVRYVKVWRLYLKLLRQEDIEADVWRWKRRSFVDLVRMVMMMIWEIKLRKKAFFQTSHKPFMIKEENDRGAWFVSDPFEDSLVFKKGAIYSTLYLLNPKEAAELLQLDDQNSLDELNADFYWIVVSQGSDPKICPVWCICRDQSWDSEQNIPTHAERACKEIQRVCKAFEEGNGNIDCSRGMILMEKEKSSSLASNGNFHFYALNPFSCTTDFDQFSDDLISVLREMIQ